jgi:GTP-binding protein
MIDARRAHGKRRTIGGYAHEAGASMIIAVNKWDAVEKTADTTKEYAQRIRDMMKFADYAPIVFISAKSGLRVTKLLELARHAHKERNKRVSTSELNRFFERISHPHWCKCLK